MKFITKNGEWDSIHTTGYLCCPARPHALWWEYV